MINISDYTMALNLQEHPIAKSRKKFKKNYYLVLEHFVKGRHKDSCKEYFLEDFKKLLIGKDNYEEYNSIEKSIKYIISNKWFWNKKYGYYLLCDLYFFLKDTEKLQECLEQMKPHISSKKYKRLSRFVFYMDDDIEEDKYKHVMKSILTQRLSNVEFHNLPLLRVAVTANVSAGKSTLINSIVGKRVSKTSMEACTGNVCYIYNKAFEDGKINLQSKTFGYDATEKDIENLTWEDSFAISTGFVRASAYKSRVCFIDTPGVNSIIHTEHGDITRSAIKNLVYDKLIYVLNANKLGTDEEYAYLDWIARNVDNSKIIFVLNKLDTFSREDNVKESIEGVIEDLKKVGFKNPILCPISAYYGLLLKQNQVSNQLTEDELDELEVLSRKLQRDRYDLSPYYGYKVDDYEDDYTKMSKKCGLYGLEQVLFGGAL